MPADFQTTRWTLIRDASSTPGDGSAHEAMNELCELYWPALYAFVRRSGRSAADAEDLVQGFLASVVQTNGFATADPERGSFRAYLLGALRHYLSKQRDSDRAQKRGGDRQQFSLEFGDVERGLVREPVDHESPDRAFDRAWARAVLVRSRVRLASEWESRGQAALYADLSEFLGSTAPAGRYRELAATLDRSEVAVKVAVHRMRRRFGELIREEVGQTTDPAGSVEAEIQELLDAVRPGPEA